MIRRAVRDSGQRATPLPPSDVGSAGVEGYATPFSLAATGAEAAAVPIWAVRLKWLRWPLGLLALTALLAPLRGSEYVVGFAFLVAFYVALASGWNFFSGYAGAPNLGYAAFVGVGCYLTAIAQSYWQWPWFWAMAASTVSAGVVALLIAPVLRLRGAYFAIATLGLAESLRALVVMPGVRELTNGGVGISFTMGLPVRAQYGVMAVVAVAAVAVTYWLSTSRIGLRLLAVREDEMAARSLGIRPWPLKVMAFTVSALVGGAAGSLYAGYVSYIDPPSAFSISHTLLPMVMAALGGAGSVWGPPLGAVVLTVVSELVSTRFLTLHYIIFGVLLILITLFLPDGLIPTAQRRWLVLRSRAL